MSKNTSVKKFSTEEASTYDGSELVSDTDLMEKGREKMALK
jgi:hypothetical protein